MQRVAGTLSLALVLIAGPPIIWLVWAQHEYSGLESCRAAAYYAGVIRGLENKPRKPAADAIPEARERRARPSDDKPGDQR